MKLLLNCKCKKDCCTRPYSFSRDSCFVQNLDWYFYSLSWITVQSSLSRTKSLAWKNRQMMATRKSWPPGATLKGRSQLSRATPASVCVNFFTFFSLSLFVFSSILHRGVNEVVGLKGAFGLYICAMFLWMPDLKENYFLVWKGNSIALQGIYISKPAHGAATASENTKFYHPKQIDLINALLKSLMPF